MQKITPCLWFNDNAEEAVGFYKTVFKNVRVGRVTRYDAEGAKVSGRPEGSVLTIEFSLDGMEFIGLNGGPIFKFTEATSFMINCNGQEESDHYWNALTAGGEEQPCGWLKDRYGVSWQIAPAELNEMLFNKDAGKAQRAMAAMLQMKRIDLQKIRDAFEGKA